MLFKIRRRRDVFDIRLSVTEIPNPDVPEDHCWPQVEYVFIWTTAPLKQVKPWVEPLRLDGIGPVDVLTARGPDLSNVGRNVRLCRGTWD